MSALTIIQKACARLGITVPTAVFSSTDDQIIQLRNLMNQEGVELADDVAWTRLITEKTFTSVAAAIQTSAVPTDFGWYLNDTMWNRGTMVKMSGPASAEEWQMYQAIAIVALPAAVFRFRGGNILVYPSPVAGQTCAYEYVSTYWASGSQTAMTADADTALLDENLIVLGVIWRFLAAKGLDYAEAFRTYELEVAKAMGRDGGKKKMYVGGGQTMNPWNANIPDGSWT
tara:strand:- start:2134 stop:2820 length:687 start_codon:yes stop_codon:yes gene_type:complete